MGTDRYNGILSRRDNEPAKEFEWQLTCLGENTKKYITFSVPIERDVKRIGKNEQEITKTIRKKI